MDDYHRKQKDGSERQLHVQQSIDVTKVPADIAQQNDFVSSDLENGSRTTLIESEFFTVDKYDLNGKNTIINDKPFQMVSVIEGSGTLDTMEVKKGDNFVICSDQQETILDGTMQVMIASL